MADHFRYYGIYLHAHALAENLLQLHTISTESGRLSHFLREHAEKELAKAAAGLGFDLVKRAAPALPTPDTTVEAA